MPATQPDPVDNRNIQQRLSFFHGQVVDDQRPDHRYTHSISNRQKVGYICSRLNVGMDDFDLTHEYPVLTWFVTQDGDDLLAGMYLCDLREQFYERVIKDMKPTKPQPHQRMAEAEFWFDKFSDAIYTLNTGRMAPKKVLH